ncbi:MAG: hypothetical protein JSV85_05455 [Candidatus Bathyarchaeota archaeon]|nr:MAG: hypothetical protein JSV85_05455 [Candidatus Bathyarchaeota archaeon]
MKCSEAVSQLRDVLRGDEMIVSSNGHISRVAYHFLPRPQLYLRGSMGLPMAVGLGLALAHQHKTIIVLTGDGNFLMGLGSVTTISYLSPPNLKIIILDNEAYATTGGQETVSTAIDYPSMIQGMGITAVKSTDPHEAKDKLNKLLEQTICEPGPKILHIKIGKEMIPLDYIPWHPVRICLNFKKQHNINSKTEEKNDV